jgi:hypothetical protein
MGRRWGDGILFETVPNRGEKKRFVYAKQLEPCLSEDFSVDLVQVTWVRVLHSRVGTGPNAGRTRCFRASLAQPPRNAAYPAN